MSKSLITAILACLFLFVAPLAHAQAPPAPVGTAAYLIYGVGNVGDQLTAGWSTKSKFGGPDAVNLTEKVHVYNGANAISWGATAPFDEFTLVAPSAIDISKYQFLNMYAQAETAGQRYDVALVDQGGNPVGSRLTFEQNGGMIPVDRWFTYGFTLSAFNAGTTQIYGINIREINGGVQPRVYLDEIAFSAARGEETTPTPVIGIPTDVSAKPTEPPFYYPDVSPWVFLIPGIIIFLAVFFE